MATRRPYHHGQLERAAIDAALDEVRAVGVAAVSMRRIARSAGVTHAALAYQFGDKAGIFTAVAAEGFRLMAAAITPAATGPQGFLFGGQSYVRFALSHPAHFEVMFRPGLYRSDDPELASAKDAAFALLFDTARTDLTAQRGTDVTDDEVRGVAMAGWSLSHGLATLMLNANITNGPDPTDATFALHLAQGLVTLGELTKEQLEALSKLNLPQH